MDPAVTIGIVTHNRVSYLPEALESAFAQGDSVLEIVVVDDGSSDGTKEYLQSLSNPKIQAILLERNQGRPTARNAAIAAMKGAALIWLDDDDVLPPDAVALQLLCLRKHPHADIICGNHMQCDKNLVRQKVNNTFIVRPELVLMELTHQNIIPNGGTLIRKSVFDRIGKYNTDILFRAEDYDFWARAAVAGCSIIHNNEVVYLFRCHDNNLSNPEAMRDQSKYQCQILTYILNSTPLERIYPILSWKTDPQLAAAQALLLAAWVYFGHNADDMALETIELSEKFRFTETSRVMKAFLYRAMGRFEEAADCFGALVTDADPKYLKMFVKVGAPRGSVAAAEEARKRKEHEKGKNAHELAPFVGHRSTNATDL